MGCQRTLTIVGSLLLLLATSLARASAVTIDFEDGELEHQGFVVGAEFIDEPPGFLSISESDGNNYAFFMNVYTTVERIDGGLFSLQSYDFSPIPYGFNICRGAGVIGTTASGTTLEAYTPHGCGGGWQTMVLGAEWTDLVEVRFAPVVVDQFAEGRIDNIVVSNVPLPASAWLLISGLLLLLKIRRPRGAQS